MHVTAVAGALELLAIIMKKQCIAIIICNMVMWSFWSVLFRFAIRLPMESHSLISYHFMWYETVGLWTSWQPHIGILSNKPKCGLCVGSWDNRIMDSPTDCYRHPRGIYSCGKPRHVYVNTRLTTLVYMHQLRESLSN